MKNRARLLFLLLASALPAGSAAAEPLPAPPALTNTIPLALSQAVGAALLNNRQLQVERINPGVARLTLRASYGYYDPIFTSQARLESDADTGGFDPANFSADAIFSADSEILSAGLIGFLPTGLSYSLSGNYAHSYGTRNFLNFDSYKAGASITASQPLLRNLWIDQPRWLIQVNKKNLQISRLGVRFMAMSVINLTQQGYYDLAAAWEILRVQQDLYGIRSQFLESIERQIELGAMTVLERHLARSQAASVRTELVTARAAAALASNNLKTLLGIQGSEWTGETFKPVDYLLLVPHSFDLKESWANGLANRPDLAQLEVNVESAELTVKFRRNQLFPLLNLIGSYGLSGSDAIQAFPPADPQASASLAFRELRERNAPSHMVGVLFSVPLTSTAERANYRLSKELEEQAELLLRQKEELVLREIADAMDLARFSFERAQAARTAVNYASDALNAEQEKLRRGTGSILLVLQAQTDWVSAKLAEINARRDYNKAISQLRFAEGALLDYHHIAFDYR